MNPWLFESGKNTSVFSHPISFSEGSRIRIITEEARHRRLAASSSIYERFREVTDARLTSLLVSGEAPRRLRQSRLTSHSLAAHLGVGYSNNKRTTRDQQSSRLGNKSSIDLQDWVTGAGASSSPEGL